MFDRAWLFLVCVLSASTVAGSQQQPPAAAADDACGKVTLLSLPNAKVTSATVVAAGALALPVENAQQKLLFEGLPAFCRVQIMDTPTKDSAIPIEVWMPMKAWNGKFRGAGNGGFAGQTDFSGLAIAVMQGYSAGGTDTGHAESGTDPAWALGHPEKVIDFGYRAVHETAVLAKVVVKAFYGAAARYSYFASCSDGGREALMEAERFPEDYDGVAAGAPANNWTGLMANALRNAQAMDEDPQSYIPAAKLPAIDQAVRAACKAPDGVVPDPRQCGFRPDSMLCKDAENDQCLTAKQARTLAILYEGAHEASGKLIFPGYLPGSETGPAGWGMWITGPAQGKSLMHGFAYGFFSKMVYEKPDWDFKTADVEKAYKDSLQKTAQALDATDPNLKPFAGRGGKLILYHGWNDPAIAALNTVNYYNEVRKTVGAAEADSFVRLFMIPGMQHCDFGPGAAHFMQWGMPVAGVPDDAEHDVYLALEAWVEKGKAPEKLIGVKVDMSSKPTQPLMTRPHCAYPLVARYKGSGDENEAASFECARE